MKPSLRPFVFIAAVSLLAACDKQTPPPSPSPLKESAAVENWADSAIKKHGGTFSIEFEKNNPNPQQAILSWSRLPSPDSHDNGAQEVVLLGDASGPWENRDAAIAACFAEAELRLKAAGYIQ